MTKSINEARISLATKYEMVANDLYELVSTARELTYLRSGFKQDYRVDDLVSACSTIERIVSVLSAEEESDNKNKEEE